MNYLSAYLPTECSGPLRYVPLLTPAVEKDSCEEDKSLLVWREGITMIAVGAAIYSGLFSSASLITMLAVPIIIFLSITLLDRMRAENGADRKAVNEYLNSDAPSIFATNRIQRSLQAAQWLVKENRDLNKRDLHNRGLLSEFTNEDVFKLLVSNWKGSINGGDALGPFFQRIVSLANPSRLEYVLKAGKVRLEDISEENQVNCWYLLGSVRAGELLKEYGFNVNVQFDGYTGLLKVAESEAFREHFQPNFPVVEHVRTLLKLGANRKMTVIHEGVCKNAALLTANPAVRDILENYSPR